MTVYLSPENKGGYMDKYRCGSGGLRNVFPSAHLENIVLPVYKQYYLQVVLVLP